MSNQRLTFSPTVFCVIISIVSFNTLSLNRNLKTIAKQPQNHSLSVHVKNIKYARGDLHFQLLDCRKKELIVENLTNLQKGQIKIEIASEMIVKLNFQSGTYALRLFHDLNDNQKLDFSLNSIPLEPVGFSNNPSLAFGLPSTENICFKLESDMAINIKLKTKRKSKRAKRQ